MSAKPPQRWWNSKRLVLTGAVLLALIVFFASTASRRSHPAQSWQRQEEPGVAMARTAAGPLQNTQPLSGGSPASQPTSGHPGVQKVLQYGRGEGELGMVHEREQPPVGPESFAVGKNGDILVADVVKQRVAVYSSDGTYLRSLSLAGIALGDVTVDAQGRIYVYDQVRRALHQYDADGTPRSTLELNPADIDTRGYFHATANALYFADAAARDVLVASLQDGALAPPDKSSQRAIDGIHADSGRIYSLSLYKDQALQLQIRDPSAVPSPALKGTLSPFEGERDGVRGTASVPRSAQVQASGPRVLSLEIPLPGIVSARYAGEDQAQRFYVQTERLAAASIVLEVLAFSPGGELLTVTRMPENDYAIWTAKLVDVRADGTIVQFLPQQQQAKLILFAN